jgi:rRNA pseudouridine-1189 N-methylase Emg1 (Nep1/Mra1 family)
LVATKKHLFTTAKKYEMPETEEAFYGLLNQLFQGENRKFEGLTIAEYLPEM